MTLITCENTDCYFCDGRYCTASNVDLSEEGYCLSEADYTDVAPEYQNEYWIALQDDQGQACRKKIKGYKHLYKDLVLYTQYDVRDGIDEAGFTESITGMFAGMGADLDKHYEEIKKVIRELPPVMSLPIYKEKKRPIGFDIPDETGELPF